MKKYLLVILTAFPLLALAQPPYREGVKPTKPQAAMAKQVMDAVVTQLKDPDSAKFQNVYFVKTESGSDGVCGEVNAKNSYGGYAGYQRFLYFTGMFNGEKKVLMDGGELEDLRDFSTTWDDVCKPRDPQQ